jgi:hypothetical protein
LEVENGGGKKRKKKKKKAKWKFVKPFVQP